MKRTRFLAVGIFIGSLLFSLDTLYSQGPTIGLSAMACQVVCGPNASEYKIVCGQSCSFFGLLTGLSCTCKCNASGSSESCFGDCDDQFFTFDRCLREDFPDFPDDPNSEE